MFLLFIIILILYLYFFNETKHYIKSDIDGNIYLIRRGDKDVKYLKKSADALAEINKRIELLIIHLQSISDPDKKYFIDILSKKYSYKILSEASIDLRYTSFTVEKQDMHICLRTRDAHDQVYDINILMYVVLHELSHLCNYDKNMIPIEGKESHGEQFKSIFKFLVEESIKTGIYTYKNYNKYPVEYCGMTLNSSIIN